MQRHLDAKHRNLVLVLESDKTAAKMVFNFLCARRRGFCRDEDEKFFFGNGVELGVEACERNRKREKDVRSHDRIVGKRGGEFPVVDVEGDGELADWLALV